MGLSHSPSGVSAGLVWCYDFLNVKCYNGGSSAADLVGLFGINGSITGGTVSNGILTLSGTNQYVNCGNFANTGIVDPGRFGGISFECWVNLNSSGSSQYILSSGAQTSSRGVTLIVRDIGSNDYVAVSDSTGQWIFNSSAFIPVGSWTCICVTWDGVNLNTYQNGSLLNSTTKTTSNIYTSNQTTLSLGTPNNAIGTHCLNGSLGATRFWGRCLTVNEVVQSFNSLRGRYGL